MSFQTDLYNVGDPSPVFVYNSAITCSSLLTIQVETDPVVPDQVFTFHHTPISLHGEGTFDLLGANNATSKKEIVVIYAAGYPEFTFTQVGALPDDLFLYDITCEGLGASVSYEKNLDLGPTDTDRDIGV